MALRRVRSWLTPWAYLRRWWRAWSTAHPPSELQALLDTLWAGRPLALYLPPTRPWDQIAAGERVWMKWSGGPIVARARTRVPVSFPH